MAKKKQQQNEPIVEAQQPTIEKTLEEKLVECENECKSLEKQVVMLRGEKTKLKNMLDTKNAELNGLYQDVHDLNEKIDAMDEEIYRLYQLAHRTPWYKKLLKKF